MMLPLKAFRPQGNCEREEETYIASDLNLLLSGLLLKTQVAVGCLHSNISEG